MEPFCNHLRPYQDIGFSCPEVAQDLLVASFMPRGICVEAEGSDGGEDGMDGTLNLLRPNTTEF